jgi:formamidopyrimidine-DNA glycosylase
VPELPDLQSIVRVLGPRLSGRRIEGVSVKEPIVLRTLLAGSDGLPLGFAAALKGQTFSSLHRRGPFLSFALGGEEQDALAPRGQADLLLIIHCMLAGRLQIASAADKPLAHLCFSLMLDNGERLSYGDEKRMGKVYVTEPGRFGGIPGYDTQGVDVISDAFTFEVFEGLIKGRRHQARVFLMDQAALSAIGNAYADEILFTAGIHPKTPCSSLSPEERRRLYDSIGSVMAWGIAEVEKAGEPIEAKVRGHMRVRNRKDEPCPACGAPIRRAGVLGHDSFFCPVCQPAKRAQKIPW